MRKCNLYVQGVESRSIKQCRRMSIAVEALPQPGPGAPKSPAEAVERMVSRGPDISLESEQKERERAVALAKAVETVATNSLSAAGEARLREIFDRHWNPFRHGLRGDPPVHVEPLTVTFKREAKVVKARGRLYSPIKTIWLTT